MGESKDQIRRYVRLTNLVPELLQFVDEGRIKMRPAVELSYLEICCGLTKDIQADTAMPEAIRQNCLRRVETLAQILEKYSA